MPPPMWPNTSQLPCTHFRISWLLRTKCDKQGFPEVFNKYFGLKFAFLFIAEDAQSRHPASVAYSVPGILKCQECRRVCRQKTSPGFEVVIVLFPVCRAIHEGWKTSMLFWFSCSPKCINALWQIISKSHQYKWRIHNGANHARKISPDCTDLTAVQIRPQMLVTKQENILMFIWCLTSCRRTRNASDKQGAKFGQRF